MNTLSHIFRQRPLSSRGFTAATTKPFVAAPANWLSSFGASVWHEFSPLAVKYNAVNLGQGFPSWQPPDFTKQAAQQAVVAQTENIDAQSKHLINQYARPNGHVRLVNVLATIYSPLVNQKINPLTQIQVTNGASGGIFCAISSVTNPGDEVIVIAPWFDIYEGPISLCGAKMVQVSLQLRPGATSSADWYLDPNELKKAVTPKTKAILLNSPHNPTGKVFSYKELEEIAAVVRTSERMVVITDEVYEFITFENNLFPRFCTLPGMWERTLNVSSAGKTFSVTGWKIGWVYGPEKLVEPVSRTSQFAWFSVSTPMQEAIAVSFETALKGSYFNELQEMYTRKRDFLTKALISAGFKALAPQGTFFIIADITDFELKPGQGTDSSITGQYLQSKDWNFCRWLTTEVGVTAIPCSAFYTGVDRPQNAVRFTFCKTDEELERGRSNLQKLSSLK